MGTPDIVSVCVCVFPFENTHTDIQTYIHPWLLRHELHFIIYIASWFSKVCNLLVHCEKYLLDELERELHGLVVVQMQCV